MARDRLAQLDAENKRMKTRLEIMGAAGSTDLQYIQVGNQALQRASKWASPNVWLSAPLRDYMVFIHVLP